MEIIKYIITCHRLYSTINANNYFEKQTMTKMYVCVHFVFFTSSKVFSHYCIEIVSVFIQKVGWLVVN